MNLVDNLVRDNIRDLVPYSSARDEGDGTAKILLDANENPYPTQFNRYPDPRQWKLREFVGHQKKLPPSQILLGNGSDEIIDLLIRAFCEPQRDSILTIEPGYGMYRVCARINNVQVHMAVLNQEFELEAENVLKKVQPSTRIIFLCSPNNPTGNLLQVQDIESILRAFQGLVVVDEAYVDFSGQPSLVNRLPEFENLVVLQTLSKAWGLAGLRLGIGFGSTAIIEVLNKIKYPYNVNVFTQEKAIEVLAQDERKQEWVRTIIQEREKLKLELEGMAVVKKVYPSDANFLLVRVEQAAQVYEELKRRGVVVRNQSNKELCADCLRITVGRPDENEDLINIMQSL